MQRSGLVNSFQPTDQTFQPISLPSLNTLLISRFTAPNILNLTLGLMKTPNPKELTTHRSQLGRNRIRRGFYADL
ncbi:hypothetical protein M407DRAFT_241014 [Tulasnella calospora MUT 4182]|uniref:Uncharacterized protein n=1 Tax=Tulasnella calospora MUT 4182 TaxID=1051891 RepID=A0A0C3QLK8_9AGAM|nr:hypothetical protein M407DRAFT_241014 [Tulasnella calospora MUT 4182]